MRIHVGKLDVPHADFARLRCGEADFPLQGGPENLRALMCQLDEDGRYPGSGGDSFMLIVKWPKDGSAPQTQTIYPFAAAMRRPGSLHYSDQPEIFPKEGFKESPQPVYKQVGIPPAGDALLMLDLRDISRPTRPASPPRAQQST